MTKLTIYRTDAHDHVAAYLHDKLVFFNDYGFENVVHVAEHLGVPCEIVSLSRSEFERRFA